MRKVSLLITHYQTGNQNASFHNLLILLRLNVCLKLIFSIGKISFENQQQSITSYPAVKRT
ncbi:hypothetical protein DLR60_05095 [Vibrio tarriae]|uniref:Orphan protein n=1 Tax=Vibrio tarriae TaxID=2014742 RepID=A0AAU8WE51_9VIBR|nr:hypothetical protein CEQ48_09200 [Vibrio tarriae]QEO45625.1 hypothetical protein F0315_10120 [Vibrio cholerae]RBM29860.1 hypothetical protein DLR61_08540 [Vibrio tarriae]RBM33193.1 hypothetical protein DLR58_12695 [Vibrio tarriae]RBM43760.1 hypothetical protein DLR62_00545 [Vibrio tarriae]